MTIFARICFYQPTRKFFAQKSKQQSNVVTFRASLTVAQNSSSQKCFARVSFALPTAGSKHRWFGRGLKRARDFLPNLARAKGMGSCNTLPDSAHLCQDETYILVSLLATTGFPGLAAGQSHQTHTREKQLPFFLRNKNAKFYVSFSSLVNYLYATLFCIMDSLYVSIESGVKVRSPGDIWNPKKKVPALISFRFPFAKPSTEHRDCNITRSTR